MAEFGPAGQNFRKEGFAWGYVSRIVFFADLQHPDDVTAFSVVCEHLFSIIQTQRRPPNLEAALTLLCVRTDLVLQVCFRVLEQHAGEWSHFLLSPHTSEIEGSSVFESITRCILSLLHEASWSNSYPVGLPRRIVQYLVRKLLQKDIFARLHHIIRCVLSSKEVVSLEGSVLEQIVLTMVSRAALAPSPGERAAAGAFRILALKQLQTLSPRLAACAHVLLVHSLPLLEQLSPGRLPDSALEQTNMSAKDFHKSCALLFQNIGDGLPTWLSAAYEKDAALSRRLTAVAIRFMSWLIQSGFQLDSTSMEIDDQASSSSVNADDDPSDLQFSVEYLQEPQGQEMLLSMTRTLFSGGSTDHGLLTSFCELLYFVINTETRRGPSHVMILTFAIRGKLVARLWRCCIQPLWKVPVHAFPDSGLVDQLLAPLSILCKLYSAFLATASKEEICSKQIPITLLEIYDPEHLENGLITVVKKCIWQNTWTKQPSAFVRSGASLHSIIVADFAQTCGRLLMQLHDNSGRWSLAPPSHFHIQSSQIQSFVLRSISAIVAADLKELPLHDRSRASLLLRQASCLIPFQDRAKIFREYVECDKKQHGSGVSGFAQPGVHGRVRRLHLLEDGYEHLGKLKRNDLRNRIRVEFVDEHGMVEAGVDGGGLFKDFMEELVKKGFDSAYGFFAVTEQQELYPNPAAVFHQEDAFDVIEFLGRMLGKAVYDGILVELPLAHFFLKKFQGLTCDLHDLPSLDPQIYRSLMELREHKDQIQELGLSFTVTDGVCGLNQEVELMPNGRHIPVTPENVLGYIYRFANYRLNTQVDPTCSAFLHGFFAVIDREWVQMFNPMELRTLISGADQRLNVANMQSFTQYAGGYHRDHPVIKIFWELVEELDTEEQRHLLKFVTGCSRPPLLGFAQMRPRICIQMAGGAATERLPTSSTCLNLLKLPPYASKEVLENKLRCAISSGTGFHLS